MGIDDWRRRINEIDRKLVELLNERSRAALEIGRLKHERGLPLYQPEREAEILAQVQRVNGGPLDDEAIRRLFERILDEARSVEHRAYREPGEKSAGKKKG
ncbi:MAG: chorismate mutase [Acidobacteria bacterium]|nr:chorismate mutase [Acidobacteriota bacterium]